MIYRLVFTNKPSQSPCPNQVWYSLNSAKEGQVYWEKETNRKLEIREDYGGPPKDK